MIYYTIRAISSKINYLRNHLVVHRLAAQDNAQCTILLS